MAAVGGLAYYFTQGGGGSSEGSPGSGEGEETSPGCGPNSGPACGPSAPGQGPTGGNCPNLVAHSAPCYAIPSGSVATASGPSLGQGCSSTGHAKRCSVSPSCLATTAGLTVNTTGCSLIGHASRNCPQPSGCFATAKGPSVGSSSQPGNANPCSTAADSPTTQSNLPNTTGTTLPTSESSASSSVRITCKLACLPSCSSFAQVKQNPGGTGQATRTPCAPKGNVKQVKQSPSCSSTQEGCTSTADDAPSCA